MDASSWRASLRLAWLATAALALDLATVSPLRGDEPQAGAQPPPAGGVQIKMARAEAAIGSPLGVGVVEMQYAAGHGPTVYPDQPLVLKASDGRALYATFNLSYQEEIGDRPAQVDRLRVSFLLRGAEPCDLSIASTTELGLDPLVIQPVEDPARQCALLDKWWADFSNMPEDLGDEQKMVKQLLREMLATRLNLPGPWPHVEKREAEQPTGLEAQFERAIGMLFGIESVKLAMQQDRVLDQGWGHQNATVPIPPRPNLVSINVPAVPSSTWIEPIATHVPAECFYLRTGSLANYRYFRQFLLGWGGSLDDIVSTPSIDRHTREKIEGQLGLDPAGLATGEFDPLISDMALVGCDPFFHDGAAVGVLFEARQSEALMQIIKAQRNRARRGRPGENPATTEQRIDVAGRAVSFISSDDNRVRSFYAIDGHYHLVTNSRYLLDRFFEAGRGERSLAALKEFRYARSRTHQHRQPLAFLYLSDPFFQNLVSPHYRIELTRRKRAALELKQYQLARLVAQAEGITATTVSQLIESRLLPRGFANRVDQSRPVIGGGDAKDSLRGAAGFFLPVADVPLHKATPSEVHSYRTFLQHYNQEWRRVDPVTVLFSRSGPAGDAVERVGLDIIIAPYAQQRYARLRQHLAPANAERVAPVEGDLLSVDTSIHTGHGWPRHLFYVGLRDAEVPFVFENGRIELTDQSHGGSYAKSHFHAAISPPSDEVLELLASVLLGRSIKLTSSDRPATVLPPPPALPGTGGTIANFGWAVANFALNYRQAAIANFVETRADWTVISRSGRSRQHLFEQLFKEHAEVPTQVRLRMRGLPGAQVEPYIEAYTFLAARRASSASAQFLNEFSDWLQLPPDQGRDAVEALLDGRIRCPLGGDFQLRETDGHPRWVGSEWSEPSVHAVTQTPESWKFPFLDWLRGLDMRFDLDQSTLRAEVDLLIHLPHGSEAGGAETDIVLRELRMRNPVEASHVRTTRPEQVRTTRPTDIRTIRPEIVPRTAPVVRSRPDTRLAPADLPTPARASATALEPARQTWILGVRMTTGMPDIRITQVYADSPASRIGLREGDVVRTVDWQSVRSPEHFRQLLRSARDRDGTAMVQVLRAGSTVTFEIPLTSP